MKHKRLIWPSLVAILLVACPSGTSVVGRYKANFNDHVFLVFEPNRRLALEMGGVQPGTYSVHSDHVDIVLDERFPNGVKRSQTFQIDGDMLTAGDGTLFLPGGTKFVKVR